MPTPIQAFLNVAEKHGIDPSDLEAVQHWFSEVLPTLPVEQINNIIEELLAHDATAAGTPSKRCYPEKSRLPSLEESPPATTPLLASRWRDLFHILLKRLLHRTGN